jgi:hypothetical protein
MKIILSSKFFFQFYDMEILTNLRERETKNIVKFTWENTCIQISPLSLLEKDKNCSKKSLNLIDHDIK